MDNPGVKNLGDASITSAVTGSVITSSSDANGTAIAYVDRMEGMTAAALFLRLAYGSGGTTVKAYVQTSLDQGTTWIDVACVVFGTASETRLLNLSALTAKTTSIEPTDGTLTDDTAVDGILGDRLRVKITSTGTYASTTLSCRAVVR